MDTQPLYDWQRLHWQCRRGMLELDYLLEAYLEQYFLGSEPEQQAVFIQLLSMPDPVLQAWLIGHDRPDDADLLELVTRIRGMRI